MSLCHEIGNENLTSKVSNPKSKQLRYQELVTVYHKDLYRYAYWLTKDKQIAEDIVQETCLRAWKSLDSLQDEKAAKYWLIKILRRENARRFERKQFDLVELNEATGGITSDSEHHQQEWLYQQMMQLEDEYREPLLLQVLGGFSGEEIAQMLSMNKNTVMTRLFRARNQLKTKLEDKNIPLNK